MLEKSEVGARVLDKLNAELKYISWMFNNDNYDHARLSELAGKTILALELEIITFAQWEEFVSKIMLIRKGE